MTAGEGTAIGAHSCDGVLEKPQTYCCIAVWRGDVRPEEKICRRARVHSCGVVLACIKGNGDVVDIGFVTGRTGCRFYPRPLGRILGDFRSSCERVIAGIDSINYVVSIDSRGTARLEPAIVQNFPIIRRVWRRGGDVAIQLKRFVEWNGGAENVARHGHRACRQQSKSSEY